MNRFFLFLFLVLISIRLSAQDDDYMSGNLRFGIKAGVNSASMLFYNNLPDAGLSTTSKFGYYLGGNMHIPLSKNFIPIVELGFENLRSEVAYKKMYAPDAVSEHFAGDISLNYLSLGICPNLAFDISHIKLNIYGGFHLSFPLSTNEDGTYKKLLKDEQSGNFTTVSTKVSGSNKYLTEGIDSGFLTGFGLEYKLMDKMSLHFDSRFRFGTVLIANSFKSRSWGFSAGVVYDL